jgi:hypothetical protein
MRLLLAWAGLLCAGLAGCEPPYLPTIAPKDAQFTVACAPGCGASGRDPGVVIDVSFVGHGRQYNVCCSDMPALRARLTTIIDYWCDGLDVPDIRIGELTVGVTESVASNKRGATLDQGEGYVAFNCDDWLPSLVARLGEQTCCGGGKAP